METPIVVALEAHTGAEKSVRPDGMPERRAPLPAHAARQLVHELRLHKAELESQNEELRRAYAELETARSRYFDLYDMAPVGYCAVSETERILEANLTAAALLGITCGELIGRTILDFISPADQDIYYLHCRRLMETGQPQSCELRLLQHGGVLFWAQLTATRAQSATGCHMHRLVLTDIHKRKVAQDQLRVSDMALRAVSEGILITTPDLCVVSANAAFLKMTGYTQLELVGANCSLFNGPLTDNTAAKLMLQATRSRQGFSGELLHYRKDGSSFWNELTISPVLDDQGQLTHFISINSDIGSRKQLDQILQHKNVELQRATAAAEQANRAKSDFLASMSHELRSPLNAILGFAQLLEVGPPALTPPQQGKVDKIMGGGWYLLSLVNEILDLALIESGKLSLALEPVLLAHVLLDCQSLVEPQADSKGIRLQFPRLTSPDLVIADPTRLKQVIVNLLSNAIKYNRTGGAVDVTMETTATECLRISVQDTGHGLSAEKISQLFQTFNRLGQECSTTEGTGIGLVVSRRLTELMGGKIGVHSTEGVGSVFWVEFSMARPPPARLAHAAEGSPQPTESPAAQDQTPHTILYVEDNQTNAEMVEQILAARPHLKLLRAADGTQGIALARTFRPDVILMDINLPGISGVDAMKILRQDPATQHIPVLAVSANAMPLDIVEGLSAGFFRYLTKPFKIDAFFAAIDLALNSAPPKSTGDLQ
ncbi:MAG: PAS domain-containing protein [Pseudomonadota bacterium]